MVSPCANDPFWVVSRTLPEPPSFLEPVARGGRIGDPLEYIGKCISNNVRMYLYIYMCVYIWIYGYLCIYVCFLDIYIYVYMCVYENRSKPMKLPSNGKNNHPLTIKNENLLVLWIRTMIEQQLFGLDVGSIY